jgi:hypothetical protein
MIGYVTVGADDIARAEVFYSAILLRLGYGLEVSDEGLSYCQSSGDASVFADFYVKPPFNGQKAMAGNGSMVAFQVPTHGLVDDLHAAGLSHGGSDEGAPGFRAAYSAGFYVGYLRDPQGNKVALYCNNPAEPKQPD